MPHRRNGRQYHRIIEAAGFAVGATRQRPYFQTQISSLAVASDQVRAAAAAEALSDEMHLPVTGAVEARMPRAQPARFAILIHRLRSSAWP